MVVQLTPLLVLSCFSLSAVGALVFNSLQLLLSISSLLLGGLCHEPRQPVPFTCIQCMYLVKVGLLVMQEGGDLLICNRW